MQLAQVPHRVLAYRTFAQDLDDPWMSTVVSALLVDDGGPVLLYYRPAKKSPQWRYLARAVAVGAGAIAANELARVRIANESNREIATDMITKTARRWLNGDIDKAFDPRRGEGYYRLDNEHVRYYTGMIHAPLGAL